MPGPVGRPAQLKVSPPLEHTIEDSFSQVGIMEHASPRAERLVGSEDHRTTMQVPVVDDLKEHVRRVRAIAEIADFVQLCGAPHKLIYGERAVMWSAAALPQEAPVFSHA